MKKLLFVSCMLTAFAFANKANAQVKVGLNVNIGSQPCWAPSGYDHAEYYYLPDIECYYYVPKHQFIYRDGNRWRFEKSLPAQFRPFDIDRGYKVVMNEPRPYMHFDADRAKYASYKNYNQRQPILDDKHDDRDRNHWKDNGYHKGWYKNGKGNNERDDHGERH